MNLMFFFLRCGNWVYIVFFDTIRVCQIGIKKKTSQELHMLPSLYILTLLHISLDSRWFNVCLLRSWQEEKSQQKPASLISFEKDIYVQGVPVCV